MGLLCLTLLGVHAQTFPLQVKDDQLIFQEDERGNRILDYSYCGYHQSESPIPDVKNVVFVPWQPEANAARRIQQAIDDVASLVPDREGFRGAVLLDKGVFTLEESLRVSASGVVLRGTDRDQTVLLKKGVDRGALIYVEGQQDATVLDTAEVLTTYVPVNARTFQVAPGHQWRVGDRVRVLRPSSKAWIASVGCDVYGGGISALGWKPGDVDMIWDRTIQQVDGDWLTLDAPLTVALDSQWGGAKVMRYVWPGRIAEVGVENVTLVSDYDKRYPKGEDHCWTGISIEHAEHCWVRRVNFKHLAGSAVLIQPTGSRITVEDCLSTEPVSEVGGMRRCTFHTLGQQTLFQRCFSQHGIHDFAAGYVAAGPNAFVQCDTEESLGFSGSIDAWACGLLFDIVNIDGHDLLYKNLGQDKNGAGWNTANSLFWQCTAAGIACYSPAVDAVNRAYGCWAQFSGDGQWAQSNNHVSPRSFFYAQLAQRLHKDCTAQARILPRVTKATSSPTVEAAVQMAQDAYTPRLTLQEWIRQAPYTASVASDRLKTMKAWTAKEEKQRLPAVGVGIVKGRMVKDGCLLAGGRHEVPWWNGKLRTGLLSKAKPHLTRFVPGREGQGLTDRIDSTVNYMVKNRLRVLDHNYGLWYERRRDDHERVRRRDADVWGPFYEQPFARSGTGTAWEGLSLYDLTRPNAWYWDRLKQFVRKGAEQGLLLFHENYFQHNILEAGAHWVDCPWRSANNVNATDLPEPVPFAGDKRIFVADMFYDITHPVRRELHKQYIRQCLNQFADDTNVVQLVSAEYTGPLHFVQFWLDVIGEWEQETGKQATVALSTTKDVQDAILSDSVRAKLVDIIDIRYWHYKTDGIYQPAGGKSLAPRQHARQMKVGKVTFAEAYRAVSEYRQKYPEKAVTFYAQNYANVGWAVLMAGGSCPVVPVTEEAFLKDVACMEVESIPAEAPYRMVKSDTGCVIYSHSEAEIPVQLKPGKYELRSIDPVTGELTMISKSLILKGVYHFVVPQDSTRIFWFHRK